MKLFQNSKNTKDPSPEEPPVETEMNHEPVEKGPAAIDNGKLDAEKDPVAIDNGKLDAEDLVENAAADDDDDGSVEMDIESYNAVKKLSEKSAMKKIFSTATADETKENKVKRWWIVAVVLLFAVAGLVLVLALTLPKDKKDKSEAPSSVPTIAPSAAPTTAVEGVIYDILEPYTLREVLADASTPQGKAFNQLISEVTTIDAIDTFRVQQRYALMTIYFSTAGDNWNNRIGWITFSEDECDWFGVSTCRTDSDGNLAVTNLNLQGNNLQGTLPSEICALHPELGELHFGNDDISDVIPWCLASFRQLKILELSNLQLTGEVHGLLTNPSLEELYLQNNQLTGSLDKLFEVPKLLADSLASEGEDPNILATKAISIHLEGNSFDGQIPAAFGQFNELTSLKLYSNDLSGSMAPEICALRGAGLLSELSSDCIQEVVCGCCTYCHV